MNAKMISPLLFVMMSCGGAAYNYNGQDIHKYFPLDGDRDWEYAQDDLSVEWALYVEMTSVAMIDNTTVATLEYQNKGGENEVGEPLFDIQWSSDSTDGVLIHSYTDHSTGDAVYFDTPIVFGEHQMNVGDSVTSQTNGLTITSTFTANTSCDTHWSTDTWDCLYFIVDDGGAGLPFAGDWWIATNWGAAQLRTTGYSQNWVLTEANFGGR